jgi:hypothetical protein
MIKIKEEIVQNSFCEEKNSCKEKKNLRGCRRNIVILVRLRVGGSVDEKDDYSARSIFINYSPCFLGQSFIEIRFSCAIKFNFKLIDFSI